MFEDKFAVRTIFNGGSPVHKNLQKSGYLFHGLEILVR